MNRIIITQSISKQYLALKDSMRRHVKFVSQCKLIVVIAMGVLTLGVYAREVNDASTKGYFLKQDMATLDSQNFQYSSIKLDILQAEKKLWDEVASKQASWANQNEDNFVTVYTYPREVALK